MTRIIRLDSAMASSLLALIMVYGCSSADAQVIDDSWIGGTGLWNVAGNWSSGIPLNGAPPGATYNVSITNGGAVTMSNGLNSSTPIDNLTVGSSSSLSIFDGNNLTITGNTLDNAGAIALNSAGHATYIVIGAPNVTLSGGGSITMSNDAGNFIVGSATANTLTNEETIQGAGVIGGGNGSTSLTLVNSGTIDANQSAGMGIAAYGGTTNTGTLESTAGSTLTLSGTFTNAGGSILADASELRLSNATVNGGTVTLTGESTLQLANGTIHAGSTLTNSATGLIEAVSVTNNTLGGTVNNSAGGVIQIDDDATVNLENGSYPSLGTVTLNSAGHETALGIIGTNVILSGGTVTMSNNAGNVILGSATANKLTNEETIQGAGSIGGGNGSISLTLVNSGTIDANQSVGMVIEAGGGTTNTGKLESTAGSTLTLTGTFTNVGGSILADASELRLSNAIVNGGAVTLTGDSTLQLANGSIHSGSTLTNSATGLIEAVAGTNNTLGGTVHNSAGGMLQIDNDSILNLEAGSYPNLGPVAMNAAASQATLIIDGAKVTLSGGTLTLSNSANNYIYGAAKADTLTNEESISGAGHIGAGQMTLVNSGTIDSDDSAGMTIQANGGTKNTGTLEATAGSTLALAGMTITNTGGTIAADTGLLQVTSATINGGAVTLTGDSTLQLANGTIHNGSTLTNSATGLIEAVAGTSNTLGGTVNNSAGGLLQIDNDSILNLQNGNYTKLGTVAMNAAANQTSLIIDGAKVTLSGGTLTLSNSANNYISGAAKADTLINEESIAGAGHIGAGQMTLTNSGTLDSDDSAGMTIQANGGTKNTGTLEVTAGSTLALAGMTVTNTGGTISADTGLLQVTSATINGGAVTLTGASKLQLANGVIHGGSTLTNSATGLIEAVSGTTNTLGGTVNNSAGGLLQIDNAAALNLESGTYASLGAITLNSANNATSLIVDGAKVTLSGGTVTMSNNFYNYIYGAATADTLINKETISGAGHIGNGQMTLMNSGTIDSDDSAGMTIQASGGAKNTGTLEATNGSTLNLTATTVTNTGGKFTADASRLLLTSASISGGKVTLTGTSTLQLNNGTVHGGSTLTNSPTGLLEIVAGANTLGGTVINPAGGILQVDNAAALNLESGTYAKLGTVTLNSAGNQTSLIVDGANVTLSGGSVTMTNNVNNYIYGAASADTLTNEETIAGAGHIGGGQMTLVNSGIINSNQSAGMLIQTSGAFTNSGTLLVGSGDLMHVLGGTFTNFSGGTLTGGTYSTSGTLEIDQLGSTGGEIVTNAANIVLKGTSSNIVDANGKAALANLATNASSGSLNVTGGRTLTTAGSFTNAGILTIGSGSTFTLGGAALFTQTSGTTTANGTLSTSGGINLTAGSLYGTGSISGNLSSSGLVAPGTATGTTGILKDSGAYTQNAGGSLDISIGGTTPGTKFDELTSTTALLAGTLNINLINGFVPTIGSKFKIVSFTSESGQFGTVNGAAINGSEHFTVTYQGTDVLLTTVSGAAASSLASLRSAATSSSRLSEQMRIVADRFALAASTALPDSMSANGRSFLQQADHALRIRSAPTASQPLCANSGFHATPAKDDALRSTSARSGFRMPAAFATQAAPQASATYSGAVSTKPYGISPPHAAIDARARFAGKVARGNLQFSLPNLYSIPRVSLSLD